MVYVYSLAMTRRRCLWPTEEFRWTRIRTGPVVSFCTAVVLAAAEALAGQLLVLANLGVVLLGSAILVAIHSLVQSFLLPPR